MTTMVQTRLPALLAAPLLLVALSGCIASNAMPWAGDDSEVRLLVDKPTAWTGDSIRFRVVTSDDLVDVTQYFFDFGDGRTAQMPESADVQVEHAYTNGGVYTVSLTVFTREGDEESATRVVHVSERDDIAATVSKAPVEAPAEVPVSKDASTMDHSFLVNAGAKTVYAHLDVTGQGVAGASQVSAQILGPTGELLDERSVTVHAGQSQSLIVRADVLEAGQHTLRMLAEDGTASIAGTLQIRYDENA